MIRIILLLSAIVLIGCDDFCDEVPTTEINSEQIGAFEYYFEKEIPIELKDGIALVGRNEMVILPFDTTKEKHIINDISADRLHYNEFDTIVQIDNSFFKLNPTSRTLKFLYTPPFTIHDFCLTPNHGICYVWGNVFVEPPKFNYYNFETRENTSLFYYHEFIPNGDLPYDSYQSYLDNSGVLKLLMNTPSSHSSDAEGVIYNINLDEIKIEDRWFYSNKRLLKIIDYNDFNTLDITYQNNGKRYLEEFNFTSRRTESSYSFKNSFSSARYSIHEDFLSVVYYGLDIEKKTEFLNWKTGEIIFSIESVDDYDSILSELRCFENQYVAITNKNKNKAILLNNTGCIKHELLCEENISNIIHLSSSEVIIRNENNGIEYLKIE